MAKKPAAGTLSFLAAWYFSLIGLGALDSYAAQDRTLTVIVWVGVVYLLLLGNHMATGSVFLRGLREYL